MTQAWAESTLFSAGKFSLQEQMFNQHLQFNKTCFLLRFDRKIKNKQTWKHIEESWIWAYITDSMFVFFLHYFYEADFIIKKKNIYSQLIKWDVSLAVSLTTTNFKARLYKWMASISSVVMLASFTGIVISFHQLFASHCQLFLALECNWNQNW